MSLKSLKTSWTAWWNKYLSLDGTVDSYLMRFISWKYSTGIVVVILILAAIGAVVISKSG